MRFLRFIFFLILGLIGILLIFLIGFNIYFGILNAAARSGLVEKTLLHLDGLEFRDLNDNGWLDKYEDWRQPLDDRVEDLLAQMTLEEKTGLMWHPPIGVGSDGELLNKPNPLVFSMVSTYDVVLRQKIRHFNLFSVPSTENLAKWYNNLQKLAEQDRLGIPVTISSDPRHGINNFIGSGLLGGDWSKWPEPIGLAAANDSSLVVEFGDIARAEYCAVGIRIALHPMADLATEPRWARINGTFGEDANLSSKITAAYIYGFQGETLGKNSVACMTKHWPGGGPQKDGWDAHFRYGMDQEYPGDNFAYHLKPFKAAFEAGTAMIMPYYGVPLGQTSEDVGMSFNKEIITDLLRVKYGYDGVVCTDWGILEGFKLLGISIIEGMTWGVDDLALEQRIQKVIDAGVDQFGGNNATGKLMKLVKEGKISENRIDESARRLLRLKFQLGLFDDPYVNIADAVNTVGKSEFVDKGKLAQRKSIVLLKNRMLPDSTYMLPLGDNIKIYIENIDKDVAREYATVVDSLEDADYAVLRLQTPWVPQHRGSLYENFFHQGDLNFKEPELGRILNIAERKPTIICIYLDRPVVFPEITEAAAGIFGEFGANDDAVLDMIFGRFKPTAILPFELPSSMQAVDEQLEDVPYDSRAPLFPFGYGLRYD